MHFFQEVLHTYDPKLQLRNSVPVSGGCINSTYQLQTDSGSFFLKWNSTDQKDMIKADADALTYLSDASPLRIPDVYLHSTLNGKAYVLLEWIEQGHASGLFWEKFGQQLATQHRQTAATFGWSTENFIGSLPQRNTRHEKWSDFFITERLIPQLNLAESNQLLPSGMRNKFENLFKQLPMFIPEEAPALLHGDLWSGNFLCDANSNPVIFDPSIHYGHRETELAFTSLFGGFDASFYESYKQHFPLEPGFENRKDIHNLYPLLVHVNLFGASYLSGIKQTLKKFA